MSKSVSVSEFQIAAVREWARLLKSGRLEHEQRNYGRFHEHVLKGILGYAEADHEKHDIDFVPLDRNDNDLASIECKGTETDLDKIQPTGETPMGQLWRYMAPQPFEWGICTNYRIFRLLKRSCGINAFHEVDFASLYDGDEIRRDKVAEFIFAFGRIPQESDAGLRYGGEAAEREITDAFYALFSDTRSMMAQEFKECAKRNKLDMDGRSAIDAAQTFLNRLIFLFFAEDKGLVADGLFMRQVAQLDDRFPGPLTNVFCRGIRDDLFGALNRGYLRMAIPKFNGGLFGDDPNLDSVTFLDYRLESWFGDKTRNYKSPRVRRSQQVHGVLSPIICNLIEMRGYDFGSEVDVNILGHVFEQSLREFDSVPKGGSTSRRASGIYYTPSYITDFICRQAILPHLSLSGKFLEPAEMVREYAEEGKLAELEKRLRNLRILDPACGSGAFLTSAAWLILDIHSEIHDRQVLGGKFLTKSGLMNFEGWSEAATMRKILLGNIYGIDRNPQSVKIAQLAMFLLAASIQEPLPDLSGRIVAGNSIISDGSVVDSPMDWKGTFGDIFGSANPGFDVIIGNPPYGAELTAKEKAWLKREYPIGGTNTAPIFTHMSLRLLKDGGIHGFIVPKSLMFSSREWTATRAAILQDLEVLVDVGKVWKEVKLEQCIYVVRKGSGDGAYSFRVRKNDDIRAVIDVEKTDVETFGAFPSVSSGVEMALGKRLARMPRLGGRVSNVRGTAMLSKNITKRGIRLVGGDQVQPFRIDGAKGRADKSLIGRSGFPSGKSVLAQNMVAHIMNPVDHIRIIATAPDRPDFAIIDTVNQMEPLGGSMSPRFLLGLLSSRVVNWYVYRFIVSRSIRTIHFDAPVTDRIPLPADMPDGVDDIVGSLLEGGRGAVELMGDLDDLFYDAFGLDAAERRIVDEQTW